MDLSTDGTRPISEAGAFERLVKQHFAFLESDHGFHFSGVREVNDGPRDTGLVGRYRRNGARADVGWSPVEGSLAVLIRLDRDELTRREQYLYLEPFVEFVTGGSIQPVVPQVYPGISVKRIEEAMAQRGELFREGLDAAMAAVAARLREYGGQIWTAPASTVREYHRWYKSRGRTGVSRQ